jgi:hypothetical protein
MNERTLHSVLSAAVAVVALAATNPALGCTCLPLCVEERYSHAEIIVQGIVVEVEAPEPSEEGVAGQKNLLVSSGDMLRYKVIVTKTWKGTVPDTAFVYSERGESECGYRFELGAEYLIYCRPYPGPGENPPQGERDWAGAPKFPVMTTGLCSGTERLADTAEDLEYLEKQQAGVKTPDD